MRFKLLNSTKRILKTCLIALLLATPFFINPQPSSADRTSYPFKKCTVSPTSVAPGKEVFLEIETDLFKLEATINVVNSGTSESIKRIPIKEESKKTIRKISLGTFTDPATYDIHVYQDTSSEQRCDIIHAFSVYTQYTGACPNFLSYNTTDFQENKPIEAYFDSVPETLPLYFAIHVDDKPYVDPLKDNRPPVGPAVGGDWKGFIGMLEKGDHTISLLYSISQKLSDAILCYELPKITIGKTSGQNPCPGGVCETALGKISSDPAEFAGKILGLAIGLAGGIALIIMVIGSIRVLTSSGDQQKLSAGRDMIVAAVAGLLFLIFSVLILKFIGVEILKIPGFG